MDEPLITYYKGAPYGLPPRRDDKSAVGTIPTKAFKYCEPVRLANGFGCYVVLPISFDVVWDGGTTALWSYDNRASWNPLDQDGAALPHSFKHWKEGAPDATREYCPPFLKMTDDHAMLQVWTGWFIKTAPGYSALIMPPLNLPKSTGYQAMAGIIRTDLWFGPLFTNVVLLRTDVPIRFDAMMPFLQVVPIPVSVHSDRSMNAYQVEDRLSDKQHEAYSKTLIEPVMARERAHYAKMARREEHK